jgi:hypothetical protein
VDTGTFDLRHSTFDAGTQNAVLGTAQAMTCTAAGSIEIDTSDMLGPLHT